MRNPINYNKSLLAAFVLLCMVTALQYGEDLKDRPDSINIIMDINLDSSSAYEELPGKEIFLFKFYTTSNHSTIMWKYENEYYLYSLKGDGHELRAIQLFAQLKSTGLVTFVAERRETSVKFFKYHKVIALQIENSR